MTLKTYAHPKTGASRGNDNYSVKTICQLTGLNEHTLRAWERRYQVVTPHRLDNGRRVYSLDDLEKLKLVTLLVRKGFLIGNIAASSIENLSALVNDAQAIPSEDTLRLGRSVEYVEKLKRNLIDYDLLTVQSLLQQARVEHGVKAFLLDILMPLMGYIGEAVTHGELGIGQEHAYSAIVRSELMQLLYLFSQTHSHPAHKRQESAKIFAIANNEGNQHEFGALISAVICAFHGFPVYYFGANMPAVPLAQAAKAVGANCILLGLPSVTLMPPEVLDSYIARLRGEMSSICQLWIGGQITEMMVKDRTIRKLGSLVELDKLLSSIRTV
jgi:DNA-binding transcriptional MerR regulator